jgi:hypothetical protein
MHRWRPGTVWLAMWAADGFFFHLDSTVYSVFLIMEVGLDPLQLVLMGTILEVSYLLFEVPTGIVADTVSRKGSIVIGYLGTGVAFLLLGSADSFGLAAASQVLYGISATFTSGADVAWLTDEVGEDAARPLYLPERAVLQRWRARRHRRERGARVDRAPPPHRDLRPGLRRPRRRPLLRDGGEQAPEPEGRVDAPTFDAEHLA